ncbi:MAG: TonB-dependent receptor [Saprospiraceae bacterium]|nr:TonB-dependent receptor [Saprospiraceae bacterium]
MRHGIFLFFFLLLFSSVTAQFTVKGIVTNDAGEGLELASVFVVGSTEHGAITDGRGYFELVGLPKGEHIIKCTYVGYDAVSQNIMIDRNRELNINLEGSIYNLDDIEIISNRVGDDPVFSFEDMSEEEIDKQNMGKDIPYVLRMTPSVVVTSDAGTGIGYTGIRVRGADPSRVNVTINGIALNDSESQGVFWVNMPDFASSVDNLQLQRGVGPSTNGAGAFGATLSLNTMSTNVKPRIILDGTIGSFGTKKLSVGLNSGLIAEKYSVDMRYSNIKSDGYVDRASADLNSYYLSASRITDKSSLRFITFSGDERTYQSWYGTPQALLYGPDANRTFNFYTYENQVDDYGQDHYQLHYSLQATDNWVTKLSAHYTKGSGFFEEYKDEEDLSGYLLDPILDGNDLVDNTDLVRRRWLDNDYYGLLWANALEVSPTLSLQFGAASSQYKGDHFGNVIDFPLINVSPDKAFNYYFSDATKNDVNAYVKANYKLTDNLSLYGDLQLREVGYETQGTDNDQTTIDVTADYSFFNPKAGINYKVSKDAEVYGSFAVANREPDRSDFTDNPLEARPEHETLYDTEIGYRISGKAYSFGINVYNMIYSNQLVPNGQLNDVGSGLRVNVDNSFRRGVEVIFGAQLSDRFTWDSNFTLSKNKIENFTEVIYDYTTGFDVIENQYEDTNISYSPSAVWFSMLNYKLDYGFSALLNTKYVGTQNLDNTGQGSRVLAAYIVNDLGLSWAKRINGVDAILQLMVYNLLDEKYSANGYTFSYVVEELITEKFYYPQAGRHVMLRAKVSF